MLIHQIIFSCVDRYIRNNLKNLLFNNLNFALHYYIHILNFKNIRRLGYKCDLDVKRDLALQILYFKRVSFLPTNLEQVLFRTLQNRQTKFALMYSTVTDFFNINIRLCRFVFYKYLYDTDDLVLVCGKEKKGKR